MSIGSDYHSYIFDDSDGESSIGCTGEFWNDVIDNFEVEFDKNGYLDTRWITDIENQILFSEYEPFLKKDITKVSFQFIYLDRHKKCIEYVLPIIRPYQYILNQPNKISQGELLRIIHQYQSLQNKKKYYNFHSLLLYDFQMSEHTPNNNNNNNNNDDVRWLSQYLAPGKNDNELGCAVDGGGRVIEYKNLLSFDAIYFHPLVEMFHDLIEFTVVLYED
jgi:hypothetical protein